MTMYIGVVLRLLCDDVEIDILSFAVIFLNEEFAPTRAFAVGFGLSRDIERTPSAIHFREGVHLAFRSGCGEAVDGDKGCTA